MQALSDGRLVGLPEPEPEPRLGQKAGDVPTVNGWVRPGEWRTRPKAPTSPESDPVPNDRPAVWDLVLADMRDRDALGRQRYGTPLQPHNGRKPLRDLYQELLDAVAYTRQELFEREGR